MMDKTNLVLSPIFDIDKNSQRGTILQWMSPYGSWL